MWAETKEHPRIVRGIGKEVRMSDGKEKEQREESPRPLMSLPFRKEKVLKLTVMIGALGIVLIALSSWMGGGSSEPAQDQTAGQEMELILEYRRQLGDELGNMVASIEGAGRTRLMLTLEGSGKNLYAFNNDSQNREAQQTGGEDRQDSEKSSLVVLRNRDGSEQALTVGRLMPSVSGVLIVCDGGGDPKVAERIRTAVSAALHITKSRICVQKMG